jgi:hypothetical protein
LCLKGKARLWPGLFFCDYLYFNRFRGEVCHFARGYFAEEEVCFVMVMSLRRGIFVVGGLTTVFLAIFKEETIHGGGPPFR